jgi:hypothetical protein
MAKNDFINDSIIYDESNSRTVLKADSIVDDIVDQFIDRSRVGKLKYGVTLDRTDLSLSDWLEHAIQEHMDSILYLKKIKTLIDGIK